MKPLNELSDAEFADLARRAAALPDAPPALIQAAIGLWPAAGLRPTLTDVARSLGRLVHAVLSFDSWASPPGTALAVRSADSGTRHLLYSAQGRDIDLRVSAESPQFVLAGQILGPDDGGSIELHLDDAERTPQTATLDAMGEFRLTGVPEGRYVLTLKVGDDTIVLPPFDIGPKPQ